MFSLPEGPHILVLSAKDHPQEIIRPHEISNLQKGATEATGGAQQISGLGFKKRKVWLGKGGLFF